MPNRWEPKRKLSASELVSHHHSCIDLCDFLAQQEVHFFQELMSYWDVVFLYKLYFKILEDATSVSGKSVAEHYKTTSNPVQQKRRYQRLVLGCQMTGVVYKFLAFPTAIADGLNLRFERSQHHWSVQYSWASNKRKALKAEHWLLVSSSLASEFGSCTYSTLVAGICPMIGRLLPKKSVKNSAKIS